MDSEVSSGLSLSDSAILAALGEGPTHGFKLAGLFAKRSELGMIWTVQRPQVYRALERLCVRGLAAAVGYEPGEGGPLRLVYALTEPGEQALAAWLMTPVTHLRNTRSELLLKLVLLDRQQCDAKPLLSAQAELFETIRCGYEMRLEKAQGAEKIALEWRLASAKAALEFLKKRCS